MPSGASGAIMALNISDAPGSAFPSGNAAWAVAACAAGIHTSMRVPPQVASISPTGVFNAWCRRRPKK